MSNNTTNFTANLLGITDENITFSNNIFTKEIHGLKTMIFEASLSYNPTVCPNCGNLETKRIIKHGFKAMFARVLPVNGNPCAIKLKKQRFLCKECKSTFVAETNLIKKFNSISNILKTHILRSLSMKLSEKDIANLNNVSHATVSRYIDNDFKKYSPSRFKLPKNLSFDEFKSTRDAKGAMSFIMTDLDEKKVIDIVENRQLRFLKRYFKRFTKKARARVKTITIDMYQPYKLCLIILSLLKML